mmetsp:Transcript_6657/g.10051  ORF Transcript_6657/g.10051 Transcript_6657/m.10051 type:complete len:217 (+) Transcript_6657:2453-3103(+)
MKEKKVEELDNPILSRVGVPIQVPHSLDIPFIVPYGCPCRTHETHKRKQKNYFLYLTRGRVFQERGLRRRSCCTHHYLCVMTTVDYNTNNPVGISEYTSSQEHMVGHYCFATHPINPQDTVKSVDEFIWVLHRNLTREIVEGCCAIYRGHSVGHSIPNLQVSLAVERLCFHIAQTSGNFCFFCNTQDNHVRWNFFSRFDLHKVSDTYICPFHFHEI